LKARTAVFLLLLVGGVAYLAGSSLGYYLSERKKADYKSARAERTASIVGSHVQLGVGDTLSDRVFETLDAAPVKLSDVISGRTYVVAVLPTCETCITEMAAIAQAPSRGGVTGRFVFVSSANPRLLADLRDSLQLNNQFLYDHKGRFLEPFGIDIYPMSFVIDRDRRIKEIILGRLLPEEIEAAIAGTK